MISIIIPTVNRHTSLVKLVASIHAQNFPADELEIIIVYNTFLKKKYAKSKDLFPKFPWKLEQVRTLMAPAKGVNHARNTGIAAAHGDLFLFIDDDCLLSDKNYLKKIEQRHRLHPEFIAIGGPYRLSARPSFWDKAYHRNMDRWLQDQRLNTHSSRALLGGNACYKSSVFEQGLRFTPGIRYGGSETPLNTLLFEQYGPLGFFEDLVVEHQSQMSIRNFSYKAYMQGKGYAWQSKLRPQQIQKSFSLKSEKNWALRLALRFYSFLFMVGFRTSILERRWPLRAFAEELFIYVGQPFCKTWISLRKSFHLARAHHER